jgi:predicted transcriptional regulator
MGSFIYLFSFLLIMTSVFLKREGATPKYKVLDFLIVAQDFDYSIKDIALHAEISYPCMKDLKKELLKGGWIILTRKVGRAQMYKLNMKNAKVQKFVDFYWTVVNEEVDKELEEEGCKHNASGPIAVSVSTQHV